jgi:hypothetical protein
MVDSKHVLPDASVNRCKYEGRLEVGGKVSDKCLFYCLVFLSFRAQRTSAAETARQSSFPKHALRHSRLLARAPLDQPE